MEKKLAEREEFLSVKQCLGCGHEGMLVTTREGTILETTPAADHILEAPSLELQGRDIHGLCDAPDAYDETLRLADVQTRCLNRSLIVVSGTGKKKMLNLSIQKSETGSGPRFVHVFQDCADLRTLESRLLQAERLATVGKFASQIAHEIRNPLNSISLNVELLEDELEHAGKGARGLIRSVLRELDRLNDIVSEYLQFSRFPKPQLKRGHIDSLVREVGRNYKPPEGVEFNVSAAPSTPEVWLDEGLLRQVLDNLIRNAVEAIDGSGTVSIETDVIDRFLVIRVKDTGVGIPAEVQAKLFEPFFTTKANGTGLGLATSQQIVFEHNGHLLVESQPGKGSTFSILLPL
jgi:signal transduction histidine kinase